MTMTDETNNYTFKTPGSVIQADSLLMRTRFGNWVSDGGFVVTDGELEGEEFSVVYDAGLASDAPPTSNGAALIARERARQVTEEGWDAEHDKGHASELAFAAETYVHHAALQATFGTPMSDEGLSWRWPWLAKFWKPAHEPLRNLVRAGALIAAAIDALPPMTPETGEPDNGQ